ncbi:PLP-dependent aminotransferase family protein [Streptomyces sp. BI20]|uniref:aminotransferase-like domain-containing protein n=1 Tax=Streptomyces sp. BI20 TaxID=3403460 RepID=UPI003C720E8D
MTVPPPAQAPATPPRPANAPAPAPGASPAPLPPFAARARTAEGSAVREILAVTQRPGVISFAGGLPAPELFDAAGLRAGFEAALTRHAGRALQYSTTEGDPDLRAAVADRLTVRGLPTTAEDLLVTTGSQQALALVTATLLEPGDTVLVENPTYLAALQGFRLAGVRTVPVACDDSGLLPEALEAAVLRERPRLLYTVPTFQNPTGRTLPAERRTAVAAIAARHGLRVLEDDPYGELRFEGAHVPWVAATPGAEDRTLLLGSFSKVLAPGLRLGWLRAPRAELRAAAVVKQSSDLHTSSVDQLAAAHYLRAADLDGHVAKVRGAYRERRDALLGGLGAALPDGSTWNRPEGGMFVWARLPKGWDATELLRRAVGHDVAFVPGAPFFATEPDPRTLRLTFTTHTPAEIAVGLDRLATAIDQTPTNRPTTDRTAPHPA